MAEASVSAPAQHQDKAGVRAMFDRIAGRYDAANRTMSAGIDIAWRRKALKPIVEACAGGASVRPTILDLGAGTLDGAIEIGRRIAGARVVGADFAQNMLRAGLPKLGSAQADGPDALVRRIAAHGADGHALPYGTGVFDAAFSAFCVRNLADLDRAMAELRRVLKPGAVLVVLEFFRPKRTRWFFDKVYNAHVLPLIGWAVSGDRDAYRYLPQSIAGFATRDEYEDCLRRAGFVDVRGKDLFPAGVASMVVARAG